jgi:cytochrome P450
MSLQMNLSWNVLDPAVMGDENSMHGLFRQLREKEPVSLVEHPDFEPFWVVTRHEDIKAISQNNAAFQVAQCDTGLVQAWPD